MVDFIFIAGSPGSGKTTISNHLKEKLKNPPMIDFGWIREFHLDREWKKANKEEEQMSYENLVFILKNRVLGERDSGFKDFKSSLSWNKNLIERKNLKNEFKVDNTHRNPNKTI